MQPPAKTAFRTALAALSDDPRGLIERAMQLAVLDRQLRQCLPHPLASHIKLGNLREGRLVFLADTPAWKARLQLHAASLLEAAQAAGIPARDICVKVASPSPVATGTPPASPLSISPRAQQTLRAAAAATRDETLRTRLLQLASLA